MTHAELLAWRNSLQLTQRAAAAALGITLKAFQELERGENFVTRQPTVIDRRTALACAALAAGLREWAPEVSADAGNSRNNA